MVILNKVIIVLLFIILTAQELLSQKSSDIGSKKAELNQIKTEISALEKEIKSKSKKELQTFAALQNYDKQHYLLDKVIGRYRNEEKEKQNQIVETEQRIADLTNEIVKLQTNYAKYVNAVYRKGKQSDLAVIFDSESISQAIRRIFYLKKFSERREKDLNNFEQNKKQLIAAKLQLEKEKAEKSLLVEKKLTEEKILKQKTNERRLLLNTLRKDKKELTKELTVKKKAEETIKKLITKLAEDDARREAELKKKLELQKQKKLAENKSRENFSKEENKQTNKAEEQSNGKFSSFQQLKGRLSWPVNNGRIIRKFGENKNLILNTITLNYGVDIKVMSDLSVKSVSDGIISAIEWIPGYGSIVIVSHADDYRTVYGHLGEIFVQEGESVSSGQRIASVGESIEGNVLHFEIWSSRSNQNPEIWLAKK